MATKRRQIAFYADEVVSAWYAQLAPGEGTRRINDYLRAAIEHEQRDEQRLQDLEQRLATIASKQDTEAKLLDQIIGILADLIKQQMTVYAAQSAGNVSQITEEYIRLKTMTNMAAAWQHARDL